MARGREVDKGTVELVLQLKGRNESLTTAQIGTMLNMDATTAGRILSTGSWEGYCAWKKEKAAKERRKSREAAVERLNMALEQEREKQAEEQVPGQMKMDLEPAEKPKPEMSDQTKMMRFLAGQFGMMFDLGKVNGEWFTNTMTKQNQTLNEIMMKLDKLNDTMNMIIRCIRKE